MNSSKQNIKYFPKMDELLIEKVRQHEILYNIKSSDYRDHQLRHEAWEEIGRDLNIAADKCKLTWEKLRRCFTNVLHRRRFKKTGSKRMVPWKFERQMAFILPFLDNRKIYEPEKDNSEDKFDHEDQNNIYLNDQLYRRLEMQSGNNEKEIAKQYFENIKHKKGPVKKNNSTHEMVQIMKENATLRKRKYEERVALPKTSFNFDELDENDMFFLSMSRMTKKLSKLEQANIKLTLSNAVLQAEMRHEQRQFNSDVAEQSLSRPSSCASTSTTAQPVTSPEDSLYTPYPLSADYADKEEIKPTLLEFVMSEKLNS